MKNNSLIAIALIFFLAIAWYRMVLLPAETDSSVQDLRTEAREDAGEGAPELAIKLFKEVFALQDTLEDRLEVFQYYKQCLAEDSLEFGRSDMQKFITETMNLYADEEAVYEMAMTFWKEEGNLAKCASVMDKAFSHEAVSEQLQNEYDEIKYAYGINSGRYLNPLPYSGGMQPVQNGESWVYFNDRMSPVFEKEFDQVTICNDGYIAIRSGNVVKLLNTAGKVEDAFRLEDAELAGAYGNNLVPIRKGGKYIYVDLEGRNETGGYDYAGVYCNKRAAVRQGASWNVINTTGGTVIGDVSEVVLDAAGRCAVGERIFAKRDGRYGMYNISGELIAEIDAEAVKCFGRDGLAAACKDGRWGFIDTDGNWVFQPAYEDAESFCNGYAAVCERGLWGFIDMAGTEAVECQFESVTSFTNDGKCMVLVDGFWRILEFLCR